jgi:NADH-quinone oxidoreductase subunit N
MTSLLSNVTLPSIRDLSAFSPELVLIAAIVVVLLLPLGLPKRSRATAVVAALGAFIAAGLSAAVYVLGRGPFTGCPLSDALGPAFSGLLVTDGLSCFLRVVIYGFLGLVCVMWLITASRRPGDASAAHPPEFFVLILSAAVGMGLMVATNNLLMVVIAVELASLPSYAMAGFQKHQRQGAEAALKYVIFGAASAAMMIYGVSLLYGYYGTLDAGAIGDQLRSGHFDLAAGIGLIGLLAGVAFKISAVPMHFWCPDVFEGAAVEVATFLSVASKAAGLALLVRLAGDIGGFTAGAAPVPAGSWTIALVIGIIASVTATIGNLAALGQDNLKRLLAYSSIAHAGYILMAGTILSDRTGAQAVMLYLLVYLFMNLGAFSVVAIVYNHTGSERMSALSGLGRRAPVLAISMALFMVSLVGLPPMAGFGAKYQLFYALFTYQAYPLQWLVAVGLLNTLISLFYYMRVVKAMFLESSDAAPLQVGRLATGWVVALAAPVTLLLVVWNPLAQWTSYFCR